MKRHWMYLKYVLKHKWLVLVEGISQGVPLLWLILHDWDKFMPSMWRAYVRTFYAPNGTSVYQPSTAFEMAWNGHQKRNKHHWQYWLLAMDTGDIRVLAMPEKHVREMLADWHGAGRALGNPDTQLWYLENRTRICLHSRTREMVESLLDVNFSFAELAAGKRMAEVEQMDVSDRVAALIWRRRKRSL